MPPFGGSQHEGARSAAGHCRRPRSRSPYRCDRASPPPTLERCRDAQPSGHPRWPMTTDASSRYHSMYFGPSLDAKALWWPVRRAAKQAAPAGARSWRRTRLPNQADRPGAQRGRGRPSRLQAARAWAETLRGCSPVKRGIWPGLLMAGRRRARQAKLRATEAGERGEATRSGPPAVCVAARSGTPAGRATPLIDDDEVDAAVLRPVVPASLGTIGQRK